MCEVARSAHNSTETVSSSKQQVEHVVRQSTPDFG
jgi:hypothetical protein